MRVLGRILAALGLVLAWVAGSVLGLAGAALRTDAGRRVIVQEGLKQANARLNGTLSIDAVSGSLTTGLVLHGVALRETTGATVVTVQRLSVNYRLRDLISGRVTLGQLVLDVPMAELVQRTPGAPFNIQEVLPKGEPDGGLGLLFAFTDVRITNGSVEIRTPIESVSDGSQPGDAPRYRVRTIEGLTARLPYLRVSSPDPAEGAIVAEIASLATVVSDPDIAFTDVRGRVDLFGDSVTVNLPAFVIAETEGALNGSFHWGTDTLRFDLEARARRLVTDEIRGIVPGVPPALEGRGDFLIRSVNGDAIEIVGTNVILDGVPAGGRMTGRIGMVLGPGETWTVIDTRLTLTNFDLEFVRGFLDTLPVAGRVAGRVVANGPRDRLNLEIDVTFRDSLVEGWPSTSLRGEGVLELNDRDGAAFHSFQIRESDIALSTVRRLVSGMPLIGRLQAKGSLVGPWLDAAFTGQLRHQDESLPPTSATGIVEFDARGETLGVRADLVFDSLRLRGLSSSFPQLSRDVRLAGSVEVKGVLDSLLVTASLAGPLGSFTGGGAVYVEEARSGVHELRVAFDGFDVAAFASNGPVTSVTGLVILRGGVSEGRSPDLRVEASIDSAIVARVRVDSARAVVSLGDSVITLNMLRAWLGGVDVRGGGRIGFAAPRTGTLTLSADADSIGAFEPWLAAWLGAVPPAGPPVSGELGASVTLEGALDAFTAEAAFRASDLRRGDQYLSRMEGGVTWTSDGTMSTTVEIDSIDVGGIGFGEAHARVSGPLDSLAWFARSRFGGDGAWLGAGVVARRGDATRVEIDSLGVLLGTNIWFADRGAVVTVSDSGVDFADVLATSVQHAGRVRVAGRFPFAGPGVLSASIEALPVSDVWVMLQRDPGSVSGELSGTLDIRGRARDPEIDIRLGLREAVFNQFRAPVIRAEARYRSRRLAGEVTLHRAGEEILSIEVDLPVDLAFAGVERRQLPGSVTFRAIAQDVDLALLEATTPMVRGVSGRLDADFGITGTWDGPELAGEIAVTGVAAGFPSLGVRHEQLDAKLKLSGDTIEIERFSVRSGPGTAQVSGYLRLEELTRPVLRLQVVGQNFRAIDVRDFLTLTASGQLEVTGPFLNATLTGHATANRGVLYFADLIEKNVINLQDTLFSEFLDTLELHRLGLGPELESRFLDSLRIDSLRVEMGNDMWMRSSEANIQLSGPVTVSKSGDQYRLTGTLQTPRGTYRLAVPGVSREFTVTRGQVRYFGTSDLDADLDIDAQHVVRTIRGDQMTVFVHIGGTLYEPDLTLTSDIRPAVSETEIISYLLFGAPSVQSVATGGAAVRAGIQSFASLVGGQVESALIQDLGIPLDYFQVRPGEVSGGLAGTEFALGKQFTLLGRTAFVTTPVRLCPNALSFGVSIEYRLSREWLLSTSVDPSRSCAAFGTAAGEVYQLGLDLFWEKSF